jgi:hypothetical protein
MSDTECRTAEVKKASKFDILHSTFCGSVGQIAESSLHSKRHARREMLKALPPLWQGLGFQWQLSSLA